MAPTPWNAQYYVYILTNRSRVLYVGVTRDLERRMHEHRSGSHSGFTSRYHVNRLVYFESTPDVRSAIAREKQIKSWRREKKIELVRTTNPMWRDLSEGWSWPRLPHQPEVPATDPSVVPPSG